MTSFLMVFFFLYVSSLLVTFISSFDPNDEIWNEKKFDGHNHEVVAFYHIVANEGTNYHSVVEQQLDVLDSSGLFDKLDKIFYATSGDKGKLFRIQNSKFHFLHYWGIDGEELETLGLLSRYCNEHPKTKVLYFHDRVSIHEASLNADFRSLLDCFVLNPNCIEALDTHDTCGWRLSPIPHPHYLGNTWWAKCHYINKLVDPLSPKLNQTFVDETNRLSDCIASSGKSFSDSWLASYPQLKPADCMNASIDHTYLQGSKFPPIAHTYCPNSEGNFGSTCDTAATLKYAEAFSETYNYVRMTVGKGECQRNLDKDFIQRSMAWYGQSPDEYLHWMKRLRKLREFKDGDAIRPVHSKQVYYYKDNCMHSIPNGGVFLSLGLDWDKIIVIPDYQMDYYGMCGSM